MSAGGRIFLSSTRLILIPHLSVASSNMDLNLLLTISLDVKVSSSSRSPTIFLKVVAVKFSIAMMGLAIS